MKEGSTLAAGDARAYAGNDFIRAYLSQGGLLGGGCWRSRFVPLPALEPFALAVVVVFFGLFPYLGNFGKHGDFSYGAYILHFPIIQLFVQAGWFGDSPVLFLAAVVVAVAAGAVLMWHGVEKRFLLRSSHYLSTKISV